MKTIKLIFTKEREVFTIEILNKIVTYWDRKQKLSIQFMPKDPETRKKVIMSRNRIPQYILQLIEEANSGKNLEEYNTAKTDEELVPIIKRDCLIKGCVLQKREDVEV